MINEIGSGVFQMCFKEFGSCVYLLKVGGKNILIDSSSEDNGEELVEGLGSVGVNVEEVDILILTHHHWDHEGNVGLFSGTKIYDGDNIDEFSLNGFEVFKVPGHSKDSIALKYGGFLFSGDVLFNNGIGRTDLPGSEPEKMEESLRLLRGLDYDMLCPGHV